MRLACNYRAYSNWSLVTLSILFLIQGVPLETINLSLKTNNVLRKSYLVVVFDKRKKTSIDNAHNISNFLIKMLSWQSCSRSERTAIFCVESANPEVQMKRAFNHRRKQKQAAVISHALEPLTAVLLW